MRTVPTKLPFTDPKQQRAIMSERNERRLGPQMLIAKGAASFEVISDSGKTLKNETQKSRVVATTVAIPRT